MAPDVQFRSGQGPELDMLDYQVGIHRGLHTHIHTHTHMYVWRRVVYRPSPARPASRSRRSCSRSTSNKAKRSCHLEEQVRSIRWIPDRGVRPHETATSAPPRDHSWRQQRRWVVIAGSVISMMTTRPDGIATATHVSIARQDHTRRPSAFAACWVRMR